MPTHHVCASRANGGASMVDSEPVTPLYAPLSSQERSMAPGPEHVENEGNDDEGEETQLFNAAAAFPSLPASTEIGRAHV